MWVVTISQMDRYIDLSFRFGDGEDAMRFIETCIIHGDTRTRATVRFLSGDEKEEDE